MNPWVITHGISIEKMEEEGDLTLGDLGFHFLEPQEELVLERENIEGFDLELNDYDLELGVQNIQEGVLGSQNIVQDLEFSSKGLRHETKGSPYLVFEEQGL